MQWIAERSADLEGLHDHEQFKTLEDFLQFMAQVDRVAPSLIDLLAEDLTALDEPPETELLQKLARQRSALSFDTDMLLTTACAFLLRKSPELTTWLKVRKIARNSWRIEHWLDKAMAAHVQRDACARAPYTVLGTLLFKALESGGLKSGSDRKNEAREGGLSNWKNAEYQLEELWWGLRYFDFMNYEEEMRIFGLLSAIAPADFQQLIAGSRNPFLVNAALMCSGVGGFSPRFTQWEACAKAAPLAFDHNGRWTRSVLLPLLLVHARNELLASGWKVPRHDADEVEVAALTAQVTELVQAVVDVLSRREDAPAMFARWSTWLMRQVLLHREQNLSDIRSHGFVDNALLEAMGKAMHRQQPLLEVPDDAAPWEAWCYRCMRSFVANDEVVGALSFEGFASQWKISPEDWRERKGRDLLERAELHVPRDDMPGLSANLLVLPLASGDEFALGWQQLWDSAYHLRDVLEFGSVDAGPKAYSDRSDASSLLLLLGCMGLACFDQAMARLEASPELLTEEIECLHRALAVAVMEALHLDDTLNRDKWQALLHHVALRRAYWDSKYGIQHPVAVFVEQQGPTIRDYLNYFQADPGDLVAFLHACMLNKLDPLMLREELQEASIDLRACVDTLKRLHKLRERRYPMSGRAIEAIKPLMDFGGIFPRTAQAEA